MTNRRSFLQQTGIAAAAALVRRAGHSTDQNKCTSSAEKKPQRSSKITKGIA